MLIENARVDVNDNAEGVINMMREKVFPIQVTTAIIQQNHVQLLPRMIAI